MIGQNYYPNTLVDKGIGIPASKLLYEKLSAFVLQKVLVKPMAKVDRILTARPNRHLDLLPAP